MTYGPGRFALLALALSLIAASPQRGLSLQMPAPGSSYPLPPSPPASTPGSGTSPRFAPAPLPNRDLEFALPRASDAPSVGPTLFSHADQYRGDGFNKGSTAQTEQEKRVRPGAGFSLHMPLSPN